jgi:hypothetical protein
VKTYALEEVTRAIVSSWSRETCHARDEYIDRGRPGDRSRGQCGTTALVIHDWCGGDVLVADLFVGGCVDGVHYWNRLPDGVDLDLTIGQLLDGETIGTPMAVDRVQGAIPMKGRKPYELLSERVKSCLHST